MPLALDRRTLDLGDTATAQPRSRRQIMLLLYGIDVTNSSWVNDRDDLELKDHAS